MGLVIAWNLLAWVVDSFRGLALAASAEPCAPGGRLAHTSAAAMTPGALAPRSASQALLAPALAPDRKSPPEERQHQRCPGLLRGYWEIGWSRSMAVVTMRFCSVMGAAGEPPPGLARSGRPMKAERT